MPQGCVSWQPGDIAACFGGDAGSAAISLATSSLLAPPGLRYAPSHVAMIASLPGDGRLATRLCWWESTTLCNEPCLKQGVHVSGVQVHDIDGRVEDYLREGGRVDVYRLNCVDALTYPEQCLLGTWLKECFLGLRYDYRGAALSGTRVWSRLSWCMRSAGVESLFCSEVIALLLMRLGRMNRENPGWFSPGRLMRRLVRTGVYRCVESLRAADGRLQATEIRRAA